MTGLNPGGTRGLQHGGAMILCIHVYEFRNLSSDGVFGATDVVEEEGCYLEVNKNGF